jgi:hypothetical protein
MDDDERDFAERPHLSDESIAALDQPARDREETAAAITG